MQIGKTRGLTWTEAFTCLLLVLALTAALLPAQNHARGMANRIQCANNLRQIGQAMQMYANSESNVRIGHPHPRLKFEMDAKPRAFTNWKQPHSFGEGAPEANDVTGAMYLLIKAEKISPLVFHCPDSKSKAFVFGDTPQAQVAQGTTPGQQPPQVLAKTAEDISNFPGIDYLSYSMQNPYPSKEALVSGWKWNITLADDFALMADLNPGGDAVLKARPKWPAKQMHEANSPNHGGEGQNVLYGDGHVDWQQTPFAGPLREMGSAKFRDNIYAADNAKTVMAPSQSLEDNVLLPAADYKPAQK